MHIIQCKVEKIEALTDTIKRIVLIPKSPLSFIAGQYLQIVMGEDDKRPFSIANAPRADGSIELHIGAEPGNQYAGQVIEKMLKDKNYSGWLVVEAEQDPVKANPFEYAKIGYNYLSKTAKECGFEIIS